MYTITLWLLMSVGSQIQGGYSTAASTQVVERFVAAQECERVRALAEQVQKNTHLRCIEAKVYKP